MPATKPESRALRFTALALRRSEECLRVAGEVIDQPLVLLDEDGVIVFASAKFAALTGCAIQDLAGRVFTGLFEEAWRPTIHRNIRASIPGRRTEHEAMLRGHDGRARYVRVRLGRVNAPSADGPTLWAAMSETPVDPSLTPNPQGGARRDDLHCSLLAAQEAERKRIAADLHDGLGQKLSAVKSGLHAVSSAINGNASPETRLTLDATLSTVASALDEVRRVSSNLRPAMLDDLGVIPTLSWFLRDFRAIYRGIAVEAEILARDSDIADELRLPIFRVVQEAMNNVAKHSRATHAQVRLERRGDQLLLTISDDGIGFDPARAGKRFGASRSCGHCCSRERVESSGGEFSIYSAPGCGVVVRATWDSRPVASK
jgi:PAS domain S-box-containing protein